MLKDIVTLIAGNSQDNLREMINKFGINETCNRIMWLTDGILEDNWERQYKVDNISLTKILQDFYTN